MPRKSEAIVFIAGTDSRENNWNLQRLVQGIVNTTESDEVEEVGKCSVAGEKGIRLKVRPHDSAERDLDVYEAHWGDLMPSLNDQNPLQKMKSGFAVLTYWFVSRIWKSAINSPYILISMTLSSLLLIAWYYGVLVLALSAIADNPGDAAVTQFLANAIGDLGTDMGGWKFWAIASVLIGALPVKSLVNISNFTKRYLLNEISEDNIGLRDRIRNRVLDTLHVIVKEGNYDRVSIVAHSFGTVVGVDILADYQHSGDCSIRFITLGSPLRFLSYRSKWVNGELKKSLASTSIDEWIDFYAFGDWLCSKVPEHGDTKNQDSRPLRREASFVQKLMGETHASYFTSQEVMEELIS